MKIGGLLISTLNGMFFEKSEIKTHKGTITCDEAVNITIEQLKKVPRKFDNYSKFTSAVLTDIDRINKIINLNNVTQLSTDVIYEAGKLQCENLKLTSKTGQELFFLPKNA